MFIFNRKIISLLMVSLSIAFVAETAAARRPFSGPVKCFAVSVPVAATLPVIVSRDAAAKQPGGEPKTALSARQVAAIEQERHNDEIREAIQVELVRCFSSNGNIPPAPFVINDPYCGEALIMANEPLRGLDYVDYQTAPLSYEIREARLLWLISHGANPFKKGFDGVTVLDDTDRDDDLAPSAARRVPFCLANKSSWCEESPAPRLSVDDLAEIYSEQAEVEKMLEDQVRETLSMYPIASSKTLADRLKEAYGRFVAGRGAEKEREAACLPKGLLGE